jgi:hypothetical protein
MGVQRHAASAALPPRMIRYPLYRRLGRPQEQFRRVMKISPPPEFDPWTIQLVASRYAVYAIPAHHLNISGSKLSRNIFVYSPHVYAIFLLQVVSHVISSYLSQ